ncbi:phosphotransferase [Nonomuraea polychroma]|uniref:phosphotransferase n=1 Tax=Nonomuraea polychroma TaxID=46176 RepID=UPI003BACA496
MSWAFWRFRAPCHLDHSALDVISSASGGNSTPCNARNPGSPGLKALDRGGNGRAAHPATVAPHDAYRDGDHRGVGAGSAARSAPRPGRLPCEARRAGLGQPALAARRRPRRPVALGDAGRGRAAAQGAHLAAALAPRFPLPVPVPQRLGEPSALFPRPWIVTTWVPGEPADRAPVTRAAEAADALAAFLTALHQPAPDEAPAGRFGRGGSLADCSAGFAKQLAEAIEMGLGARRATERKVSVSKVSEHQNRDWSFQCSSATWRRWSEGAHVW